ncbi:uncharacterized protein LOC106662943 [Cimex lectularius]|uniref:Uncharacterized protein n=1 Tax=Cimex lectularius TaxID=79782 RepID=A0A8I6RFJ4_CIMLE|nr:uncharacterized protein LOC106662943 [Cimex lectularius]
MDPWKKEDSNSHADLPGEKFEDDFVEKLNLPDSADYLARLERKLASAKSKDKGLLESLEKTRQDCIVRLLTEDVTTSEPIADEDIPTKWLKSYINPQQALTVGELVELVKADHLAQASDESQIERKPGYLY